MPARSQALPGLRDASPARLVSAVPLKAVKFEPAPSRHSESDVAAVTAAAAGAEAPAGGLPFGPGPGLGPTRRGRSDNGLVEATLALLQKEVCSINV